uniref:Uncharacterized protein LOC100186021 n=1 Tax=Phallusia mammillata TaxID=59560 RepID=A0A6F9DIK0_9ASCI|nr:uncharacterized protein LOC100186021 [Phallusia mammillata]
MTIDVETNVVESYLMLTANTTKVVFFSGYSDSENCSSSTVVQNEAGDYVFRLFVAIPFDDCGISINSTADDIQVEGQIYADILNQSMLLSYAVPIYNVSCTYGANYSNVLGNGTLTAGFLPIVNQSNVAKVSGSGTFQVELTLYPDATLSRPLPNLPTVSAGTEVFVLVSSSEDIPNGMRIFVDICVASSEDTYTPNDPTDVIIIEDGCLKNTIPSTLESVTDERTLFSFMVFRWTTPGDDYVYIHCVGSLCLTTDPDCTQSCTNKRRKRRAPVELETSVASIKIHLKDEVTKTQNTTTVSPYFNSTEVLPGFCRHPYQLAGLILFTFLFLLTVVVLVIYTSRHIGFHDIAKHTSSQYCKGSSVSDIQPPTFRPSFFTDAENNNGPTTSHKAVFKSAVSALAVGTSVVPAATENHRSALMQEIGRVQNTRLSQVSSRAAPPKFRSVPGVKRPVSTFLGSSSESNYESEVIPLTKSKTLPGYKTTEESVNAKAATRIHFEGVSVDQTAM